MLKPKTKRLKPVLTKNRVLAGEYYRQRSKKKALLVAEITGLETALALFTKVPVETAISMLRYDHEKLIKELRKINDELKVPRNKIKL